MRKLAALSAAVLIVGGAASTAHATDYVTRGLLCIHHYEGSWWDSGAPYYGGLQFDLPTWRSVGGRGYPNHASISEQLYRGRLLYQKRGWWPWPNTARYCHLL